MFSRELRKPLEEHIQGLTLSQVGLGQSRGYITVRELPEGSAQMRWCVLRDDKLWLFESPDTPKVGTPIPLEKALIADGARSRTASTEQLSTFEVRAHVLRRCQPPGGCLDLYRRLDAHRVTDLLMQVQTARGRVFRLQAKSSGDANMWIRACRQHTAKETENQIMDKAERMIMEVFCVGTVPLIAMHG